MTFAANEAPDPAMEQIGILSLQAEELQVEHYVSFSPRIFNFFEHYKVSDKGQCLARKWYNIVPVEWRKKMSYSFD